MNMTCEKRGAGWRSHRRGNPEKRGMEFEKGYGMIRQDDIMLLEGSV